MGYGGHAKKMAFYVGYPIKIRERGTHTNIIVKL